MNYLKKFISEEDGFETIEVVVIIGILLTIALVFREKIIEFVDKLMKNVFDDDIGNKVKPTENPKTNN